MNIFKLTLRRLFSNPVRVGVMFIAPILFITMFVLSLDVKFSVGIVDDDMSYFSKAIAVELSERYNITMINKASITSRVAEYGDGYVIHIPEGFEDLLNGPAGMIELLGYYQTPTSKVAAVEEDINGIIARMRSITQGVEGDMESAYSIYDAYREKKFDIIDSEGASGVQERFVSAMGFLIQFLLYMSIATTGIMSEDKQHGTYYRNFYAPIKMRRYLFESLLAFMTVGFLQVTIVFLFVLGTMNFAGTNYDAAFFFKTYLIMMLFSIVAIALGLFVVNIFKSATAAYTFMGTATTPLVMLGGCYWDKSLMPDTLNMIGKFLPTTWAMDGIRLVISSGTTEQFLEILGILLLFTACFFALGLTKRVDVAS